MCTRREAYLRVLLHNKIKRKIPAYIPHYPDGKRNPIPTCDARFVREKPSFEGEATRDQQAGGRCDQWEQKHVAYLIHRLTEPRFRQRGSTSGKAAALKQNR